MGIRRYKTLYDATAAGTGSWIRLDSRYETHPTRTIRVSLVAGDTMELQGVVWDTKSIDKSFLDTIDTKYISSIKTYTQSEQDVLEGPWTYVRAVKSGTNGEGLIEGFI